MLSQTRMLQIGWHNTEKWVYYLQKAEKEGYLKMGQQLKKLKCRLRLERLQAENEYLKSER